MTRKIVVLVAACSAFGCSHQGAVKATAAPPSAEAAARNDERDIGHAMVVDQQDLGGVEQGPGSGVLFHNESNGTVVCRLYVWRDTDTSPGNSRIAMPVTPGGTTGRRCVRC